MDFKPILHYGVRETLAPGETNPTVVPVIIDRQQPVDLETVVENCIDRGLIAGLKPAAAHGIAEGIAEQIAKEFADGNGVAFGQYFYGRLYLDGTVDANGTLTDANKLNVRLYKGNLFKLSRDSFKMMFDGDATAPKFTNIVNSANGTRGEVVLGASATINGSNLNAAGDTNLVKFTEVDPEGEAQVVTVDTFTAVGPSILTFDCPATLVAGKSYSVQAFRTDSNGVTRSTATKTAVVTGAAPVPVDPPVLEHVGEDGWIIRDDDVTMSGSNLTLGTGDKVEVRLEHADEGDPWVDVTGYVDTAESNASKIVLKGARGSETDEGVWIALDSIGFGPTDPATFRVTTAGGTASINASME